MGFVCFFVFCRDTLIQFGTLCKKENIANFRRERLKFLGVQDPDACNVLSLVLE